LLDVVKTFLVSDVKDNNNAVRAAIVAASNGAETFLAGGIPLQNKRREKKMLIQWRERK
jgi:hypothetical protein